MLVTKWNNASIQIKLIASFTITLIIILAMNLFMYMNINSLMARVDEVYVSNLNLNELSDALQTRIWIRKVRTLWIPITAPIRSTENCWKD